MSLPNSYTGSTLVSDPGGEATVSFYFSNVAEAEKWFGGITGDGRGEAATEPNNDEVICPSCCTQFRAIPVNVQQLMLDAGFEPPFTSPPQQEQAAPGAVPVGLIDALRHQRQVDEDGTECGVSRQAVDQAITILESLSAALPLEGRFSPFYSASMAVTTDGWLPIETAKKSGRDVLLYTSSGVRLGFWDEPRGGVWSIWPGREPAFPTHWKPLPAAPKAQEP